MLKLLGRIGKGKATVAGIAALVAGTFLGADALHTVLGIDAVTDQVLEGAAQVLQGVGAGLSLFGVGRKAGVALEKDRRSKL